MQLLHDIEEGELVDVHLAALGHSSSHRATIYDADEVGVVFRVDVGQGQVKEFHAPWTSIFSISRIIYTSEE